MDCTPYTLDRLVNELREARAASPDPGEIIGRVRSIAERAAARHREWLRNDMCEPDAEQGFGFHLLHEEAGHELARQRERHRSGRCQPYLILETGERVKGDVLNLIPPMRAADIARKAQLVTANERWCGVDWTTMESVAVKNVHVLGDATMSAPAMPKSGHMANQHGKAAAAAIIELLNGRRPEPPTMVNTCYSFIDDRHAIHVSSVHRFDAGKQTLVAVTGAGGVSVPDRAQWAIEGSYATGWAQSIWADMLA